MTIGFVGKPKGVKDVLFERGLLNPDKFKSYTNHGTKGAGGVVGESTSFFKLMSNCEDFKTETTAMHELMELLGIGMEQTPKGHLLEGVHSPYPPCTETPSPPQHHHTIPSAYCPRMGITLTP